MAADVIEFRGIRFRRYPGSPHLAKRSYYSPGIADRRRGVEDLHREVWKAEHGPIPAGHHIHHVDGDTLDNEPANLVCLSPDEHKAIHPTMPGYLTAARASHLDAIRPAAAEWHRSANGRAWHVEHGRASWDGREPVERTCERCGKRYGTRDPRDVSRFCSNACKAAARRASGADDVERVCAHCGTTYRVDRYKPTRTCSRRCAWGLRKA